jgi:uncharacterized protein (DUF849 family)
METHTPARADARGARSASRRAGLQVALNGDLTHPAMPRTADEIAFDAAICVWAGATAPHFHIFDEDLQETLEEAFVARTLGAVRRRCPGVPITLSTYANVEPDPERRLALISEWSVLPDAVSANQGEDGIDDLAAHLMRRGVRVEACLLNPTDAARFVAHADFAQFAGVAVESLLDDPTAAQNEIIEMEATLRSADVPLARLHHGVGAGAWDILRRAAAAGHNVRTGLEDTFYLPDGRAATGNADLVRAAVSLMGTSRGC